MAYLKKNFVSGPLLADLAKLAVMNRYHFHCRFTLHFGMTPWEVVTSLRVEHAKGLIHKGISLPDVAERCGFSSQSHFTRRFKEATGLTPRRWRAAQHCPAGSVAARGKSSA